MAQPTSASNTGIHWLILGCILTLYFITTPRMGTAQGNHFIPLYMTGSLMSGWGAFLLWKSTTGISPAEGYAKNVFVVILLQLYFAPFFYWWLQRPLNNFFMTNTLALVLSILYLPLPVWKMTLSLDKKPLRFWPRYHMVMVLLPALILLIATGRNVWVYDTNWVGEISEFLRGSWSRFLPGWIITSYFLSLLTLWRYSISSARDTLAPPAPH